MKNVLMTQEQDKFTYHTQSDGRSLKAIMIIVAMMIAIVATARPARPFGLSMSAMSYDAARNEALFLSDKMAYELKLSDAQYNAVYEINLDYLMSVNGRDDVFGTWWTRRNADLQYVLTARQYKKYAKQSYFYRPISWHRDVWVFNIYSRYTNRRQFYKARPIVFVSYKGGNNRKGDRFYADHKMMKHTAKSKKHDKDHKHKNHKHKDHRRIHFDGRR